jgi:hypothetical protein
VDCESLTFKPFENTHAPLSVQFKLPETL